MESLEIIENLGLSPSEASTYLALLKLGGSQASQVAKEVGVKRTTIYDLLLSLRKKGLVIVHFRGNKRVYHAQKPQRVADIFKKKLSAFQSLIPTLQSLEQKEAKALGLQLIQTKEELVNFYENILISNARQTYDSIGNTRAWMEIDEDFFQKYWKNRAKAKIKVRCLLTDSSHDVNPTDPKLLRDFRYLPKHTKFESTIDIYSDKILIINPRSSALAILITSPVMRDIFASMFELLWSFIEKQSRSAASSDPSYNKK